MEWGCKKQEIFSGLVANVDLHVLLRLVIVWLVG